MSTSGVYADSYTDTRHCDIESIEGIDCDFYGEVEIYFDPETWQQSWECPLCHEEHHEGMDDEEDYDD